MQTLQEDQYVQASIGSENVAFTIRDIHEIIKMRKLTHIPASISYLLGIIDLRGTIVPVLSLRHLLGMVEQDYDKHTRIVVVNASSRMTGIVVDRVHRVVVYTDIQAPPAGARYLAGIGRNGADMSAILNLNPIVNR